MLQDVEAYFYFIETLSSIPSGTLTSFSHECDLGLSLKEWCSNVYLDKYPNSSLLSDSYIDSIILSSTALRNRFLTDTADRSRKRKAVPTTVTEVENSALDRGDNSKNENPGGNSTIESTIMDIETVEVSDPVSRSCNADINSNIETIEGNDENITSEKRKRTSKLEGPTPSSTVPDGNKRKRKKSSVAKEVEEGVGSTSRTSIVMSIPADTNNNLKSEGGSGPKSKRSVVRDSNSLSSPVTANLRFALLTPFVSKLVSSPLLTQNREADVNPDMIDVKAELKSNPSLTLPPALQALLDFWVRALLFLDCRIEEAMQWKERAAELMSRVSSKVNVTPVSRHVQTDRLGWDERAKLLLSVGHTRGIEVQGKEALQGHLEGIRSWAATASAFLGQSTTLFSINNESLPGEQEEKQDGALTYLALSDFIKAGELLQIDQAVELVDLRAELRKGKSWLSRYNRIAPGGAVAAATINKNVTEELDLLITEARTTLRIDVREELEAISQATRRYCLCRQLYHGSMVGCDECDEWYHFQCVGLTQFQVERADKYVCIRCSLKNSFCQAANLAAQITNRWSAPEEASRARDARRIRVRGEACFSVQFAACQLSHMILNYLQYHNFFLMLLIKFLSSKDCEESLEGGEGSEQTGCTRSDYNRHIKNDAGTAAALSA